MYVWWVVQYCNCAVCHFFHYHMNDKIWKIIQKEFHLWTIKNITGQVFSKKNKNENPNLHTKNEELTSWGWACCGVVSDIHRVLQFSAEVTLWLSETLPTRYPSSSCQFFIFLCVNSSSHPCSLLRKPHLYIFSQRVFKERFN